MQVVQQLQYVRGEPPSLSEPKTAKGRRPIELPAVAVQALRDHRRRQLEERLGAR